jgi:hypothetical protein
MAKKMTREEIMNMLKYAGDMDDVQFYKAIEQ